MGLIRLKEQFERVSAKAIQEIWPAIYSEIYEAGFQAARCEAESEASRQMEEKRLLLSQVEAAVGVLLGLRRRARRLVAVQSDHRRSVPGDGSLAEVVNAFRLICIEAPGGLARVPAGDVYKAFKGWWRVEQGGDPPSQRSFGLAFGRHFPRWKVGGRILYRGAVLNPRGRAFLSIGQGED